MSRKRFYNRPQLNEILLDVDISVCMATEYTPPVVGDKPGTQGSSSFESTTQVDDSGIKENPFRE